MRPASAGRCRRNRRHAELLRHADREVRVVLIRDGGVVHQLEIAAAAAERPEPRAVHQPQEQVALGLIERRKLDEAPPVGQEVGQRELHRSARRERHELVDLAELRHQRGRRHRVADLPAGHMVHLAERADDEAARGKLRVARHALVLHAVEDDVLVDLVAENQDVGAADRVGQRRDVLAVEHRAGRVVGRVDDEHARARRDRGADLVPVH